jgi:diamine N-acetyltransferase
MIVIRPAGESDIPAIQQIAQLTWPVTYGPILPQQQLDYMLELIYSTAALEAQLQKGHHFLLATEEDNNVGFASYGLIEKKENDTVFKLHKIYIDPAQQGKGIGKLLLDKVINEIKQAGATQLILNVNRFNKARNFYEKLGFTVIAEEDIDIGNGYFMNDYVMRIELRQK